MAGDDFHIKNTSSVHLRDLSKLVSVFSEEQQTLHVKNHKHELGDPLQKKDFMTKPQSLQISTFTHDHKTMDQFEHLPGISKTAMLPSINEPNKVTFEEYSDDTVSEEKIKYQISLDSASASKTFGIQHSTNSLYLISELCDRLTTTAPQSSKNYGDNLATSEATFIALETPITSSPQRLNPYYEQTVVSRPNIYWGYTHQNPSTMLNSRQIHTTDSESYQSIGGITAPHRIVQAIAESSDVTENNSDEQHSLDQRRELLDSCPETTDAISHMQQVQETLSPSIQRGTTENEFINGLLVSYISPPPLPSLQPEPECLLAGYSYIGIDSILNREGKLAFEWPGRTSILKRLSNTRRESV